MKHSKLNTLIMTVVAGMLVAPGFSTQAVNEEIVKQSPEQFFGYTWDGNSYPMPTSIGVAPGFVPFNDIFANTLKNSSSTVLTNSKGADIGVEITKDQSDTQSGSIWNTPGNELDLTKSFSATMQFYLGKCSTWNNLSLRGLDSMQCIDGCSSAIAGTKSNNLDYIVP